MNNDETQRDSAKGRAGTCVQSGVDIARGARADERMPWTGGSGPSGSGNQLPAPLADTDAHANTDTDAHAANTNTDTDANTNTSPNPVPKHCHQCGGWR